MKRLVKVRFVQKDSDGTFCIGPKEYSYVFNSPTGFKNGGFAIIPHVDGYNLSVVKVVESLPFSEEELLEREKKLGFGIKSVTVLGTATVEDYFSEKERVEKIAQINADLANQFRKAEKMALYKKLAETDPVMKGLLDELEKLGGTVDVDSITDNEDLY